MQTPVLLFGATGQLGARLHTLLIARGYEVTALDRAACDFATADSKKIEVIVRAVEPTIIINAAAYTAVDRAESEKDVADHVNALVPEILAKAAQAHGVPFIHFSTDYVFDGARGTPYPEDAPTRPINRYGASKLAGEEAVLAHGGHVFRLQWVYDRVGQNFVNTMLRLLRERDELRVVADQLGAPSLALHIAEAVLQTLPLILSGTLPPNVYHLTADGATSWHGFACAIAAAIGSHTWVVPITSAEYPQTATRPRDTRLDCRALAAYGIHMPHWQEGLRVFAELEKT